MITVEQLRGTGRLTPFTDAELEALLGATTARAFAPGEVIFTEGSAALSCFVIVSGTAEVVKTSEDPERLLSRFSSGSIVGQLALVTRSTRTASLRALTAVTALELTHDVFDHLVGSSSPLAYRFQVVIAIATGRQLREADRRLSAIFEARARRAGDPAATADQIAAHERAMLQHLHDAASDVDVPFESFESFDIVESVPPDHIIVTRR